VKSEINGTAGRSSGDINLIAALMSQGISLDPVIPMTLIERDQGPPYATYRYGDVSDDGTVSTDSLIASWNGEEPLPPDHGFSQVCRFLAARPRGIQRTDDLLAFAVDYLREHGHTLPGLRGDAGQAGTFPGGLLFR